MEVTRVEIIVRADQIGDGNTFKYIPAGSTQYSEFIVIGSNRCFEVFRKSDGHRVDKGTHVLVYNIGAQTWGIVPVGEQVIATVAELIING